MLLYVDQGVLLDASLFILGILCQAHYADFLRLYSVHDYGHYHHLGFR